LTIISLNYIAFV